jgi:hypothetical protein
LIGLNQAKADEYLKGIDGVQEEKVEFLPSFIKLFPRLKNHIYLNIKVADKDS